MLDLFQAYRTFFGKGDALYQLFSPSPDLFNVKAAKKPENTERDASESLSFIE